MISASPLSQNFPARLVTAVSHPNYPSISRSSARRPTLSALLSEIKIRSLTATQVIPNHNLEIKSPSKKDNEKASLTLDLCIVSNKPD